MIEITKDSWVDWKKHPVTQFVIESLLVTREELKEGIAEGQDPDHIQQHIGRAMAIKDAVKFMLEDIRNQFPEEENIDDDSSNRT